MLHFIILITCFTSLATAKRPHIIFILADDLGFNDVGFHGSGQIPTPNIDALAYSGLILNNYYVNPICTPSRSALMTGKYPIHTGMQHGVLYGAEPSGLPLCEKLLPQYLQELGYVNHIVGKWHLGSWKKVYTPLYRGFVSHLGYWTGHQDYYDHTAMEAGSWGLDMRKNMSVAYELHGEYSTDIFTKESVRLIKNHDPSSPLFLYLAHVAVHSGNPYEPLRAPDEEIAGFGFIENYERRKFAAMLSKLDESVGQVVKALGDKGMLENSIIVFSTDNGGAAAGFNLNAASNYPLRGVKNTYWEGGVKGAGLIWSPLIQKPFRVSRQMMHIADWLPTLLEAAGADTTNLTHIDGLSIWKALSENSESPREEILHNIDDILGISSITVNNWKLIQGTTYKGAWDNWYGPSGRWYQYNISSVENGPVGVQLKKINKFVDGKVIKTLRAEATIQCGDGPKIHCNPLKTPCFYNILKDPCELKSVAKEYPLVLKELQVRIQQFNATAVPPIKKPVDPKGDPKNWNRVYTNFGDFENPNLIVL
ncbi:hypothetical protein ABEB36_005028 [Hypothenemus hampei]|uniref:Sulfatase N-terminal domain-containing protein n=1 Tax=Hypothenemus hampei TaxID=57062 RepID=A0ABD1EZ66_HYPHA